MLSGHPQPTSQLSWCWSHRWGLHTGLHHSPKWAGLALEPTYAMFPRPYSSCFLAVCTCMCLETWGLYDWKWKAGAAWTRHTLCQPELLRELLFVLKAHGWWLWIP